MSENPACPRNITSSYTFPSPNPPASLEEFRAEVKLARQELARRFLLNLFWTSEWSMPRLEKVLYTLWLGEEMEAICQQQPELRPNGFRYPAWWQFSARMRAWEENFLRDLKSRFKR